MTDRHLNWQEAVALMKAGEKITMPHWNKKGVKRYFLFAVKEDNGFGHHYWYIKDADGHIIQPHIELSLQIQDDFIIFKEPKPPKPLKRNKNED